MKRIGLVLMTLALAGVGCLPQQIIRDEQKPPFAQMKPAATVLPVTADEVTEQNATEKARQLAEELEQARRE